MTSPTDNTVGQEEPGTVAAVPGSTLATEDELVDDLRAVVYPGFHPGVAPIADQLCESFRADVLPVVAALQAKYEIRRR